MKKIMVMNETETVTIPRIIYESMAETQLILTCLEVAGVEYWSGYDYAIKMLYENQLKDNQCKLSLN